MEDKASSTISIIGIPKTATMEQVSTNLRSIRSACNSPSNAPNEHQKCLRKQLTAFWRLPFQILGAFADPSGVPMQGMKIKNVVPGKTPSFSRPFFLGTFDRLHVPRHFAFCAFETRIIAPVSSYWLPSVACGLKPFSKGRVGSFSVICNHAEDKGYHYSFSTLLAR